MAGTLWSPESEARLVELLDSRPMLSWEEIAAQLGKTICACQGKKTRLGYVDPVIRPQKNASVLDAPSAPAPSESYEFGETEASWTGTVSEIVKSEDDLKRVCQVDLGRWKVASLTCKAYQMGSKDNDGIAHVTQMYSVSARFALRAAIDPEREIKALADRMLKAPPVWPVRPVSASFREKVLLEIIPADAHFGKYCYGPETGGDYDLDIAIKDFRESVEMSLARAESFRPSECLLVIGNDMFNSDNMRGETTAGTRQDQDTRYMRIFREVLDLTAGMIQDLSSRYQSVRVVNVPGNHDEQTSQLFSVCLEAWHRTTSNVTFDTSMRGRKYVRFGRNLLGFAHGDKEKLPNLPLIMAQERPEDWAATICREWHTGHQHRSKQMVWMGVDEQTGVIVRSVSALSRTDAWHERQGYVAARRGVESFLYGYSDGYLSNQFAAPSRVV